MASAVDFWATKGSTSASPSKGGKEGDNFHLFYFFSAFVFVGCESQKMSPTEASDAAWDNQRWIIMSSDAAKVPTFTFFPVANVNVNVVVVSTSLIYSLHFRSIMTPAWILWWHSGRWWASGRAQMGSAQARKLCRFISMKALPEVLRLGLN